MRGFITVVILLWAYFNEKRIKKNIFRTDKLPKDISSRFRILCNYQKTKHDTGNQAPQKHLYFL